MYKVLLEPDAFQDIQHAIDFYDSQQQGLGTRFETVLNSHLVVLHSNPNFQIRYDNVHCLPMGDFPFMIHFTINETDKTVIIRGVFHTSRAPKVWKSKRKK